MSRPLLESAQRCLDCGYSVEDHLDKKCLYGPVHFRTWRCSRADCTVSAYGPNNTRVDTGLFQYYHRVLRGPGDTYYHVACADELGLTALCTLFVEPKL